MLDFIVVGAMKSGTTTLFHDLSQNPLIFMPDNKEPMYFSSSEYGDEKKYKAYRSIFKKMSPEQIVGEGSTTYTMMPLFNGVVDRVFNDVGADLKIIYMVRDPYERLKSHLYHDCLAHRIDAGDTNSAVFHDPRYISVSKYYYQIIPWIERYGEDNVMFIKFEDYVSNKPGVLNDITEFLELPVFEYTKSDVVYNQSASKLVPSPFVRDFIADSEWYKNIIKPSLPGSIRSLFSKILMSRGEIIPDELSEMSKRNIALALKEDIADFLAVSKLSMDGWSEYERFVQEYGG